MTLSDTPAYFSVRDIHAYYGESYIVQGVSFEINEGEILALLGRNGAGKTSTLRAIARTGDPQVTQGEIWLDGDPLHAMPSFEASRAGLGLVPEDRRIIQADLLRSVLSKKSCTDEHSSLSNCMTGTSLIEPTPSKLFATVFA